jgi:hypothetical protein
LMDVLYSEGAILSRKNLPFIDAGCALRSLAQRVRVHGIMCGDGQLCRETSA